MPAEELLQYGEWSGPGWTAGMPASFFAEQGLARRMGAADRAVDGIDRYDNFVAKAHDLNEYDAQDALRLALADLGLIDNAVRRMQGGREAYVEDLVNGAGGADLKRFASYDHYAQRLRARSGTAAEEQRLCAAFVRYYTHIVYSNLQFAVDSVLNDVNRLRNASRGAFRMAFQLLVAPHWFLAEAMKLELKCARMQAEHGAAFTGAGGAAAALAEDFVAPAAPYFRVRHGEAHVPVLTTSAMLGSTREDIIDAFPLLVAAARDKSRKVLARRIVDRSAGGFANLRDLADFLEHLPGPRAGGRISTRER